MSGMVVLDLAQHLLQQRPKISKALLPSSFKKGKGNFVDSIRVQLSAGAGGQGGCSFGGPSRTGHGKPTGGNGGKGGSIDLATDPALFELGHLPAFFEANRGGKGGPEYSRGNAGREVCLRVPVGTMAYVLNYEPANIKLEGDAGTADEVSSVEKGSLDVLSTIDMDTYPLCLRAVQGGMGGKGNADMGHQNRDRELGWNGARATLHLELKMIAHAGLVGIPNAGKSSFLAAVSNAKPDIAPYPFTTLRPSLGILKSTLEEAPLTIADIPGLVEGAHMNVGLGHAFLKHIIRCKLLIYVLDMASSKPWDTFHILQKELRAFDSTLVSRPGLILANKSDLKVPFEYNYRVFCEAISDRCKMPVLPISAQSGDGIAEAMAMIQEMAKKWG